MNKGKIIAIESNDYVEINMTPDEWKSWHLERMKRDMLIEAMSKIRKGRKGNERKT